VNGDEMTFEGAKMTLHSEGLALQSWLFNGIVAFGKSLG